MIKRYCVFGNPIEQSRSPIIHKLFAEQVQRRVEYGKTLVEPGGLDKAVRDFVAQGGHGCNVTVPFKGDAFQLCDSVSDAACVAQAVNTIRFMPDGKLVGHNTDGTGLVRDITVNLSAEIKDKSILLVGAGGAARGILQPLMDQEPASITITNRSMDRANALARAFSESGKVTSLDLQVLNSKPVVFDLVLNATSLGLEGKRPQISEKLLGKHSLAYDLAYSNEGTAFIQWAKNSTPAAASDGLGMLLEQAADAFFIWEDVRPKTRMILPQLR